MVIFSRSGTHAWSPWLRYGVPCPPSPWDRHGQVLPGRPPKRVSRVDPSSDEEYVIDDGGEVEGSCSGEVSDALYATGADSELGAKSNTPTQDASFRGLLEKVANDLAFKLSSSPEDQSRFLQMLRGHSGRSRLQVPLHDIIPSAIGEICQAPSSVVPTNKRIDRCYLVSEGEGVHLMSHPSAESMIASAANDQARSHRVFASAPPDQEARKWDALGKKVYASASLGIRISSYMAHFSQYRHDLWSEVTNLVEFIPGDKCEDARRLAADGIELSKALMQGALDLCDTTVRGERDLGLMSMSRGVRDILLGSRKDSTRRTYNLKWRRFASWCAGR
nr:PREDICTED: uncharacterized protein LOC106702345 [Latimeria chalumnae]|eukprot:XP_014339985.1 PREDICTED: uncharacterized protein LOC106702345 [Latimeria chalumnae]